MDKSTLLLTQRKNRHRRIRNWVGGFVLSCVANVALLIVLAIFVFIAWKSFLFLTTAGGDTSPPLEVQTSTLENILARLREIFGSAEWHPERADAEFGMLAMLYGSVLVTVGAMMIAVPVGVMSAIVLSDMVPFQVRQWIKPIMELLAAIPSVALGFFAIKVVAPWLQETFGFPSGTNALNASLILAIMAIPTIVSVAEDALSSLGGELREGAYALGSTQFETLTKVIIPAAHSGILTAIILGMMRAIGETMVVWMAAGNASNVPVPWYDVTAVIGSFSEAVRTMTAVIAADMGETSADSIHRSALFAVGFVLLIFTFLLNIFTEYLSHRFKASMGHVDSGKRRFGLKFLFRPFFRCLSYPFRVIRLWREHAMHGLIHRLGPKNHWRIRLACNEAFTGVGFLSVLFLGVVLLIVLGPLLGNGREAFLFRETVEHRLFLLNHFQRGNEKAVLAEFEQCRAARKPVYDTLDRFAWLAPEPLLEQAAKNDRATRSESEQALVQLRHELEVTPSGEAKAVLEQKIKEKQQHHAEINRVSRKLMRTFRSLCESPGPDGGAADFFPEEYDLLRGTPSENTILVVQKYMDSLQTADLDLRDTPVPADPFKTYSEVFRELRHRMIGSDGGGGLLGPENREGMEHLPPEVRYGTSHWVMSQKYCQEILQLKIWQPRFDKEGNPLPNEGIMINRRDLFDAPPLADLQTMLDNLESGLPAMMNPRWTFYWGFFTDTATPGHFLGGIGPEILGTLLITFFSILFALPVGVATAAYLVETSREGFVTKTIRMAINTLAGVPSIVFGLFGLAVIIHYVTGRPCILAGSLTLSLLILPVLIRSAEEAIRSVPQTYREASLGLGASSTRCFFTVTLPAALPGILTGTILAMSRAAGETAPLLFTCAVATGGISRWKNSLWEQTPVLSYSAYDIAVGDRLAEMVPYNQFGIVATLLLLVLLLNLTAILLRGRIARKLRGG